MALVCKLRDVSAPVLVLPSFADVRQGGASFTCSYECYLFSMQRHLLLRFAERRAHVKD